MLGFLPGGVGIKKLGGVRIHGSHVFKNSLAGSRLGPELGCSRPVMLTQHPGTLRLLLPASSLSLPSRARQPVAPTHPLQQVPKHSPETPQDESPTRFQVPPRTQNSTVQEHATLGKERRGSLCLHNTPRWTSCRTGEHHCCARASANFFLLPRKARPSRFKSKFCTQPFPRGRRTT